MPYKFKGKRDCKQSDGESGKFLTVKKDGSKKCYKSEKQYKAAQAWAHESHQDLEEPEDEKVITEEKLRKMIRRQLSKSWKAVKNQKILEAKEDQDFQLDELEGLNLPPILKKLLDPNITPAKYSDIDQMVDQSGNVPHQSFAIAAFILNYADMDEAAANTIITKARALVPKILQARKKSSTDSQANEV